MLNKKLIIIASAARSFSSLSAGVLKRAGAWWHKHSECSGVNPYDTYENISLINSFNGAVDFMQGKTEIPNAKHLKKTMTSLAPIVLENAGMPKNKVAFVKHPSIVIHDNAIQWPFWEKSYPDAKWLIVRRDAEEIAQSHYKKYGEIRFDTRQVLEQLPIMKDHFNAQSIGCFEIWPGRELNDPNHTRFKEMVAWAGLEWNKSIAEYIDPKKQHHAANVP